MKIKKILYQHLRDFTAIYECEHCGELRQSSGYDDKNFHENVIPKMICEHCKESGHEGYVPMETKYEEWEVI